MDAQEIGDLINQTVRRVVKKPPETGVIEIFKDSKLRAEPEVAEVSGEGLLEFSAVGVDVTIFLPHQKLQPVEAGLAAATVPDPYIFKLAAGESKKFKAVDEDTMVAYYASREVFGGYIEGLSRPPVIIIKKVNS